MSLLICSHISVHLQIVRFTQLNFLTGQPGQTMSSPTIVFITNGLVHNALKHLPISWDGSNISKKNMIAVFLE